MVNRQLIKKLAEECGCAPFVNDCTIAHINDLRMFAEEIAKMERLACAKLCSDFAKDMTPLAEFAAKTCEKFILARKL